MYSEHAQISKFTFKLKIFFTSNLQRHLYDKAVIYPPSFKHQTALSLLE